MMNMGDSIGYGYGIDDTYQDDYYGGGTALQREINRDYKGETVDFSQYSNKNVPKPSGSGGYKKYYDQSSPDELLP